MDPWKRFPLHLAVAVLATAGAASGLMDDPGPARVIFWFVCLAAALYNAVLFGVGWQRNHEPANPTRSR